MQFKISYAATCKEIRAIFTYYALTLTWGNASE